MAMDAERARRVSFIPTAAPPLQIDRAEGVWLFMPDGRRILDGSGGAVVSNIGHGRKEVAEVAARALERLTYVVPPWATEERVALTERLVDGWLPPGLSRVMFTSGGSESVDAAIRLARAHHVSAGRPERHLVVGRQASYHGVTLGSLAVGGHDRRRAGFEPLLHDHPKAMAHYCLRCPLESTYPACAVACADDVERVITAAGPERVAAFIAEPVVGAAGGALTPPAEYWPRVADICRRHGVLLIADEVMSGFGRTGRNFGLDHWDVVPDILVGGKGLSGGYAPIGGVFTTDAVVAPIAEQGGTFMFHTYGAHPASCAVADRVLEIIEREHLVERAATLGKVLRDRLAPLEAHPNVAEVRGLGMLQGIEFVRDRATLEPFPSEFDVARRVQSAALRRGAFVYAAGSGHPQDVVLVGPAFVITEEEIDMLGTILEAAIDDAVRP